MTYQEQIKDPRWQKRRLSILERDEFMCQSCGNTEEELQVHHIIYYQNRMIWDYEDDELLTLCSTCHKNVTEEKKSVKSKIDLFYTDIDSLSILNEIVDMLSHLTPDKLDNVKEYIYKRFIIYRNNGIQNKWI